ncbi:MAG: ABC transporter permease subunit [Desulfomonilaceae bacterium]|nr:ABC transporter permease subunit [Desulfomonilaceae bacterium]
MIDSRGRGPKKTRAWVLLADKLADRVITVGGILVIAAVLGMMVFFLYEVAPLFKGGSVKSEWSYRLERTPKSPLGVCADDYNTIAATVGRDGEVVAWHVKTGRALDSDSFDLDGKDVTAFSQAINGSDIAFGFSDGTVRLGKIRFETEVLPAGELPKGTMELDERDRTDGRSVFSLIPGDQIRRVSVAVEMDEEIQASTTGSPIAAMDHRIVDFGEKPKKLLLVLDARGAGTLSSVESKLNLFTRKASTEISNTILPRLEKTTPAAFALVNDLGDSVYFAEESGKVHRYNTAAEDKPFLAETVTLLPAGVKLTEFGFLLGGRSLVVGGSDGSLTVYFLLKRDDARSKDGATLVPTREFEPHGEAVTGLSLSRRDKTFATSDSGENIWIRHGTSQKTILRLTQLKEGERIRALSLSPRLDGILALYNDGTARFWELDIPHPEASLRTLLGEVWYEGYPEPSYTWQSTGATDAFEPKLSIRPLIFGTIKATFYSLLFAIPLALLAAIYTSEFLPHRIRSKVKPMMEIMASLPSVVLGFVAALVLAPVVETWIAAVILVFAVLPLSLIFSAYLWQMLPPKAALRLQGIPKFCLMFVVVGAALYLSYLSGPAFEKLFFGGDFRAWVSSDKGSSAPFLFLMSLPAMALVVGFGASRLFGYRFNRYVKSIDMPYSAFLDMLRWLGIAVAALVLSYLAAVVAQALGADPRGGFVGTYVQRNTLIVGFAMGFAVIPIIYTLAEDALNAVPEHLRSASLGCGATLWQTAVWIVLPTAVSGVFSAVMIGMGRAVGETMIVVMSAGNTPLMDWNVFNGLRALSANIAVELPEAPKDGTLYRVLFLTALVLFSMTFVINTVAEVVRQRFRKRSMQL